MDKTIRTLGSSLKTGPCMVFLEHLEALAVLLTSGNAFPGPLCTRGSQSSQEDFPSPSQCLEQQVVCGMSDHMLLEWNHCFTYCNKLNNTWSLVPPDHLHT